MKIQINKKAKASAIMLVLFILTGVMLVVFGSSSVIISGLKMGNVQSQSTRAYFTAEAGAERLLYDFRKDNLLNTIGETTPQENIFPYYEVHEGSSYEVNYDSFVPLVFTILGTYEKTRRSVEVSFY